MRRSLSDSVYPILRIERYFAISAHLHPTHLSQTLRRTLHQNNLLSIRNLVERGHEAVLGIKGNLIHASLFSTNIFRLEARFHGKRYQRSFHRITVNDPGTSRFAQMCIIAKKPRMNQGQGMAWATRGASRRLHLQRAFPPSGE